VTATLSGMVDAKVQRAAAGSHGAAGSPARTVLARDFPAIREKNREILKSKRVRKTGAATNKHYQCFR
jgi:hypothetical protein